MEADEQQPIANVILCFGAGVGILYVGCSGLASDLTSSTGPAKILPGIWRIPPCFLFSHSAPQNEMALDKYRISSGQKKLLSQQAPALPGDAG